MPIAGTQNRIKRSCDAFIKTIEGIPPYILAAAIVIYLIAMEMITFYYAQPVGDVAEFLNNAYRVWYGEVPYKDFWLLFTPGEVVFPALIYKIIGVNADALRFVMIFINCCTSIMAFYFGRDLFKKNWLAAIFALLYYYSSVIYHYTGASYIHFYYILMTVAVWMLTKFYAKGQIRYTAYAGAALAAAVFFRLYESGAGLAGMSLALLYFIIATKTNVLKAFGAFAGGFAVVLLIEFLPFAGIIPYVIREAVFESVKNGTSMNLPYFWDATEMLKALGRDFSNEGIMSFLIMISHIVRFIAFTTYYILPFVTPILIIAFFKFEKDIPRRSIALTFFLWGMITLPKGLGRSDLTHMAPSAAPLIMFALYSGYVIAQSAYNDRFRQIYKWGAVALVAGMFLTLSGPLFRIPDQFRMPFTKIYAPYGSYASNKPMDVEGAKFAIENVLKYTRERDYIFVTPWSAPALYAMTHRRNATYYDSMNDPVIRPSAKTQERVIDALIASKTKLIVHADWGYDEKPEQRFKNACRMIQSFIESNYTMVGKHGAYEIWLLKNS
ncbi:MAG: hypothetical protein ACM3U1_04145 [Chloroflexota bacterium]